MMLVFWSIWFIIMIMLMKFRNWFLEKDVFVVDCGVFEDVGINLEMWVFIKCGDK